METKTLPSRLPTFSVDDRMFDEFREIRKRVWFEATRNAPKNKEVLKKGVIDLANKANLNYWRTNAIEVRYELWRQIVEKIFYAGYDAAKVNASDVRQTFRDYKGLCSADWDCRVRAHRLAEGSGLFAREYLAKDGAAGKIRHPDKVAKVVRVGRSFAEYFDKHPETTALSFVTRQDESEDVWELSGNLDHVGLSGQLTQLHLLMDLGFDCIKPDIVISRLVLSLGWLATFSELPTDLTEDDLRGKGRYRGKFAYTESVVIKPIVDLGRAFACKMREERETLGTDIGWVSSNPIREFDIFMVSFGQRPDPSFGIEVQLWEGDSRDPKPQGCPAWKGGRS